jgi:hypothetical protein
MITEKDKTRFWKNVVKLASGCWEWTGNREAKGYGRFGAENKMHKAHRFSYELHYGPIPEGKMIIHSCDNPPCINPDHISAGTCKDNSDDMISRNRAVHNRGTKPHYKKHPEEIQRGERIGTHKVTESQIKQIRSLYASGGYYQHVIAKMFHISQTSVWRIVRDITWKHVT